MNRQLLDQLAHAIIALIVLTPLAIIPHPVTGILAGFLMGFLREVEQHFGDEMKVIFDIKPRSFASRLGSGAWLDVATFTVTGGVVGWVTSLWV